MLIHHDAEGNPVGLRYGGVNYYYLRNAQNDIIGIVDTAGEAVVEYTYDAWGNILSTTGSKATTLGKYNPLRYRSYFYDTETGLYYLQSRYYNPEMGRFISADDCLSVGHGLMKNNMFQYCFNNPLIYTDSDGFSPTIALECSNFEQIAGKVAALISSISSSSALTYVPAIAAVIGILVCPSSSRQLTQEEISETTVAETTHLDDENKSTTVYRVFGKDAKAFGHYWSPTNPKNIANYRQAAGLPSGKESNRINSGRFTIKGEIKDWTGIDISLAKPLDGNSGGGIIEYYVPNPRKQIRITGFEINITPY